jgi:hypothetical protein
MIGKDYKASEQALAKVNPNIVPGAMIVGAIMIAIIGTFMPSLVGLTGPEAFWIPVIFYAVAVVDIGIALFFRSRLIKARRSTASGVGTVQRQ